jgi:hypothetical protein
MKAYKLNLTARVMLNDEQAKELKKFNIFNLTLNEQLNFLQKYKANISQVGEMECEGKVVSLTTIGYKKGYSDLNCDWTYITDQWEEEKTA